MVRRCTPAIILLMFQVALAGVAFGIHAPTPFDATQWSVKNSITANFGPKLPNATVSLLASQRRTGEGASGEPVYTANVIVTVGGKVIYQFSHEPLLLQHFKLAPETTFINEVLELTDVTGDGVPEILFHTGCIYADNYEQVVHVLHYVGTGAHHAAFQDIHLAAFVEDQWQRVAWLTYAGHALIIVAREEMREFHDPEDWCFQCGRYHRYQVYEWNRTRQRMVLRGTIPHTKQAHGEEDPFQEDRRYILERLRRIFGPPRARPASAEARQWPVSTRFDPAEWDTVKTLTADFGPTLPSASIQLLVSKAVVMRYVYSDGRALSEHRMVNVVVQSNGHVIYQYCWLPPAYHNGRPNEEFFRDEELELRDVTNDGIPEILFHSGVAGQSSPAFIHALHYDPASTAGEPFRDIFLPAWEPRDPDILKFTWLEIAGHTLAVAAVPEDTTPEHWGHRYDVYEWSNAQQAFALWGTVASTHQSHDWAADPFNVDAEYLRAELIRRYSPTPVSP